MPVEKKDEITLLCDALLQLENQEECRMLLDDLFTISEISAAAQRMTIAEMLYRKRTCGSIAAGNGSVDSDGEQGKQMFKLRQRRLQNSIGQVK